jgi:exosortase E/protease (VPEID-CTERM system)
VATLWLARHLLGLWYADIHYQLPTKLLGTATFQVTIAPECSGYEGVGLVLLLLTLYLWLFRTHLRFPQAVLLLPIGVLLAWVANVLRITTLIALGTSWSPAVAQGGFHSQAGWIAFLLVGLGMIAVTQRYHVFTVATPSPSATVHTQYATALVVPLLVMMATMVVTSAVSSGVDWLYPLRVITTGMALWAFRKAYHLSAWRWSWHAPVCGMTVFGIWMCLEPAASHSTTALANGLTQLPPGLVVVWLGWRVLGSVLTVPLAEELAFRGYVIHKLVARDFETVPPGQFTWWACLVSSVLFGVLHGRWLAGTLAGIGYALALRHRGYLADAVVAHMTTNALIAAYVLHQHAWALWL